MLGESRTPCANGLSTAIAAPEPKHPGLRIDLRFLRGFQLHG